MSSTPHQFRGLRFLAGAAFFGVLLGALGAIAYGVAFLVRGEAAIGAALTCGGLVFFGIGLIQFVQTFLVRKATNTVYRIYNNLLETTEMMQHQGVQLHTIAENSLLSDWAKRVAYREKDFEYLRDLISGAVVRQDMEAAEHLIREMDEQLGYREEAKRLREEMEKATQATRAEKVEAAVKRFDELCGAHKWDLASSETERLTILFPEEEKIRDLSRELEGRKQQYKRSLLKDYDRAVQLEDMDRAHDLLLELDKYLTPNEVAALKDSAKGVFRARLLQMGVQFTLAVSEKKYAEAISIGESVINEFPNSRYAHEIADRMPTLRKRAEAEVEEHEPQQIA